LLEIVSMVAGVLPVSMVPSGASIATLPSETRSKNRMASALAEGFCRAGLLTAESITVYDPAPAAREALAACLPGVRFADTPAEAAATAEIVWLAVKPQQAADACGGIAAVMPGRTLVSILAGLSTTTLAALSGTPDSVLDAVPTFVADPAGKEPGSGSSSGWPEPSRVRLRRLRGLPA
jgi:hypothetical protein